MYVWLQKVMSYLLVWLKKIFPIFDWYRLYFTRITCEAENRVAPNTKFQESASDK